MALPSGAVLEATRQDVSRADAPAVVIGRTRVENPGNPPIKLEASLENTYWKLTQLGDDTVTVASRQPEPHLILARAAARPLRGPSHGVS